MTQSIGTAQFDPAARCWPGIAARITRAEVGLHLIAALLLLTAALAMAPLSAAQPSQPDSDHDGLVDADETSVYGTDPLTAATDGDRSSDGEEVYLGTNPLTSDAVQPSDRDGDGLLDDEEVNVYGTSPDNPDTDDDGRPDGPEVAEGTDPLVKTITTLHITGAPGGPVDSDGDGLDDGAEATYGTDPTRIDTDNDGLKDGEEVTTFGTSPTTWDTDGDGYNDWEDAARAAIPLDSDGDGRSDADERAVGTNLYVIDQIPPDTGTDEPVAEEEPEDEPGTGGDGMPHGDEWGADPCHPPVGEPNDVCMEPAENPEPVVEP